MIKDQARVMKYFLPLAKRIRGEMKRGFL